jgi:hypothetical protein
MTTTLLLAALLVLSAMASSGTASNDEELAWRQVAPYIAPDFEAHFPDDEPGGLDERATRTLLHIDGTSRFDEGARLGCGPAERTPE